MTFQKKGTKFFMDFLCAKGYLCSNQERSY